MRPYELLAEWSAWGWPLLANHLWQATLVSLLALAAASLLKRAPARARYHVWLFALVKFTLPSVLLIFLLEQAGLDLSRLAPSAERPSPASSALPPILSPVAVPAAVPRAAEPPAGGGEMTSAMPAADAPEGGGNVYALITCLWLAGCAALLLLWLRQRLRLSAALKKGRAVRGGREYEALQRVRSWLGIRARIGLVVTPAVSEPGVWRVWRPVVVLPEGVAERLGDAELEAVLMHEVSHVERRDNLAGNLQRAVCCLFWFHPVVWLIDRRLLAEREQACDDAVVSLSGASEAYADSIAKVCGHCLGWDVAGVSGFAGADLKKRIERIVSGCAGGKLSAPQRLVVGVVLAGAVALSILAGQVHGGRVGVRSRSAGEVAAGGFAETGEHAQVHEGFARAGSSRDAANGGQAKKTDLGQPIKSGDGSPFEVKAPAELIETTEAATGAALIPQGPAPPATAPEPQTPNPPQPSQLPPPPADTVRAAIVRAADADYGDLKKFTGRYEVDPARAENFVLDVSLEGGELWLKPSHGPRRRLIRETETDFSDAFGDYRLTAIENDAGRVVGLRLNSWGPHVTARKLKLPPPSSTGNTTFRLKGYPNARIVAVAGTFNNWNQSQLLFAREGDEWLCRVYLPPGTHQYKFIVDGNWLVDPANSRTVHDERGILNSLLRTD
ncbi:MAG TPA: M56 family metallopeptidase [Pyrinomonadaceae bacterium]|nr:M56 family metallopeptidase [Pyrinomonadaceae bacterium]